MELVFYNRIYIGLARRNRKLWTEYPPVTTLPVPRINKRDYWSDREEYAHHIPADTIFELRRYRRYKFGDRWKRHFVEHMILAGYEPTL